MMANPLREGYKREKRWCERRLANQRERERERERYTRGKERKIVKEKEAQHPTRDSMGNTCIG